MSYILNLDKLRMGDVILSSGSAKVSKAIMLATNSKYSHAMLYVGNSIIHADGSGIFSINPQRQIYKSKKDILVLRFKESISDEKILAVCQYARTLIGSLYSTKEATLTKLYANTKKTTANREQFCSRLVAQCYESIGYKIVNNPDYCSPEDIRKSSYLFEVDTFLTKATPEQIEFSKKDDPILKNQQITYYWLNKTRDLAKEREGVEIQTLNDVDVFMIEYPKYDSEISKYIHDSGYLDHFDSDVAINPYRYDYKLFRNHIESNNIPPEIAVSAELEKEPGLLHRFATNYSGYLNYYNQTKLEYFKIHVTLYKNLLSLSIDRLSILHRIASEENLDIELIQTIDQFLKVKNYI